MNNKYIIKVEHPILRAGVTIETEASEGYVVKVTNMLLKLAREINDGRGGSPTTSKVSYETSEDGTYEIYPNGTRRLVVPNALRGDPDPDYIAGVHRNPTVS